MPQNEDPSTAWKKELGIEWKRIHETWLHTLGNITLTAYNSEYSDRPFNEKRDISGGFKESPLRLNKGFGQLDQWHEEAIKERASRLADTALEVWAAPKLSSDILDTYNSRVVKLRNDKNIISSISVTDIVFDDYLGKWNYRAIPK